MIPEFSAQHIESDTIAKILTMTTEERKAKGINKSTLWYQRNNLKMGKNINVYNKVRVKI
jgi:hypothetical protein